MNFGLNVQRVCFISEVHIDQKFGTSIVAYMINLILCNFIKSISYRRFESAKLAFTMVNSRIPAFSAGYIVSVEKGIEVEVFADPVQRILATSPADRLPHARRIDTIELNYHFVAFQILKTDTLLVYVRRR